VNNDDLRQKQEDEMYSAQLIFVTVSCLKIIERRVYQTYVFT